MTTEQQERVFAAFAQLEQRKAAAHSWVRSLRVWMAAIGIAIGAPVLGATVYNLSQVGNVSAMFPADDKPAARRLEVTVISARDSFDGAAAFARIHNASAMRLSEYRLVLYAYDSAGECIGQSRVVGVDLAAGETQEKTWHFSDLEVADVARYEPYLHSALDSRRSVVGRTFYAASIQ